jgi:hypothetical protein
MPMNARTMAVVALLSTGAGLLAAGQGTTTRTEVVKIEKDDPARFVNDPGWTWLMWPHEFRLGEKFGQSGKAGIVSGYAHVDAGSGGLRVFLVQAGPSVPDPMACRLVAFDAARKRYVLERRDAGGFRSHETELSHEIDTLSPKVLPPDKVTHIGIERISR